MRLHGHSRRQARRHQPQRALFRGLGRGEKAEAAPADRAALPDTREIRPRDRIRTRSVSVFTTRDVDNKDGKSHAGKGHLRTKRASLHGNNEQVTHGRTISLKKSMS